MGKARAQKRGKTIFSGYNPLYSLAGFLVGALVGMTGVGGGSLMTPVLVLLFGFHPATAVGTDLLYASVTKSVGTAVHGSQKTVDWHIVGGLALGSVPASLVTLFVMSRIGVTGANYALILNLLLGAVLFLTSLAVFFRPLILRWAQPRFRGLPMARISHWTVILGAILGRAGLRHLGGRRRARNDGSAHPLSEAAGVADRWKRYRPRGPADADRRHRALADRFGRFHFDGRAAGRFDPRDHRGQPAQQPLFGRRPAPVLATTLLIVSVKLLTS